MFTAGTKAGAVGWKAEGKPWRARLHLGFASASAAGVAMVAAWQVLRHMQGRRSVAACSSSSAMQVLQVDLPPPQQGTDVTTSHAFNMPANSAAATAANSASNSQPGPSLTHGSHLTEPDPSSLTVYYFPQGARTHASRRALKKALQAVMDGSGGLLGLDAEWQPEVAHGSQSPISLVQIASHDTVVLLRPTDSNSNFSSSSSSNPDSHIHDDTRHHESNHTGARSNRPLTSREHKQHTPTSMRTPRKLPPDLEELLGDPWVMKAGMGIGEDVRRLHRDCGCVVRVSLCPGVHVLKQTCCTLVDTHAC